MKFTAIFCLLLILACKNSKEDEKAASTSANTNTSTNNTNAAADNVLVGEWSKAFYAKDLNGNKVVDENEKESPDKNYGVSDYFKFSADGRCEYESIKFKGTWEIVEENSKKSIYIYPLVDGQPMKDEALRYRLFAEPTSNEFIINISDRIVGYKKMN